MNIAIIRHFEDNTHYLFSVPEGVDLKEREIVLVKNRRGETNGVCVCDSFHVKESPLKALMRKYGAHEPLAPVIGRYHLERWEDGYASFYFRFPIK